MSLTINAKAYSANRYNGQTVGYVGPLHSTTAKDTFVISVQPAKPTAVFSGLSRSDSKMTRTLALTGSLTPTGDMIGGINIAAPVGAASADVDTFLNDLGSYVSSASFKDVVKKQLNSF